MILLPSFRQMKLLRYFFVLFSCLGITGLSHAQETSHPKAHKENHLDTFFTKVVLDEYRWLEDYERVDLKKWIAEQRKHTEKKNKKRLLIGQYKDGQGRLICYPKQKLNK